MKAENDQLLSRLTIRIQNPKNLATIGSGIIYYSENLLDNAYILTAAHCLFSDGDAFKTPSSSVNLDIYDPHSDSYRTILYTINHELVFREKDRDVAVLIVQKSEIETITGTLPVLQVVKEKQSITTFVLKGFPNATKGQELACIYPTWSQAMVGVKKFQLNLNENYSEWAVHGFSGSGVFVHANDHLYLHGIFTRFRSEEKGKVIYCQYIETINELLEKNYQPTISFTFLGEHGLTRSFFKIHIQTAIKNLGPRFNERLNFRLPIAQLFSDIAKDDFFKQRFLNCLDKWLLARFYSFSNKDKNVLKEIDREYEGVRMTVLKWIPNIKWNAEDKINLDPILSELKGINIKIEKKRIELYRLRGEEEEKNKEEKKDHTYRPPYEQEIQRLYEISRNNRDFFDSLESINIPLSNYPCLLIQGEAGCGKSHLLGDISNQREKAQKPSLLLLGQLFKKEKTVWENILDQLHVQCSKIELLNTLNNIGSQTGSRVLIMIDALNEGAGKDLWYDELAGFISEISAYKFIGLVLTVRSTYYNALIPGIVQDNAEITHITHEGFKGNEYATLRLFCKHYDLLQPNFPILSPEFTNPLFLQLICEGVKASEEKIFPQGFQGVTIIFNYYLKAITQKLNLKRDEYRLNPDLAKKAIHEMAQAAFDQEESRVLRLENAFELFDKKFEKFLHLLNDLIYENVFIQTIHEDYKAQTETNIIYFAYERFGDYIIAEQLLKFFTEPEDVKKAFHKENKLGKLILDGWWRNKGILESLAVLLPEKYSLEIVEVYDWVFNLPPENSFGNINEWLNHYLLDSLRWRSIKSIDNDKLSKWFKTPHFRVVSDSDYFTRLIELTTVPGHPFNSDKLFRILKSVPMPKRDAFWQQYLFYNNGSDDNDIAYPITRLIDWAWQPKVSDKINSEIARLTAQTLTWVLSTTNRELRDRTTKAMVNLLEEQHEALIAILNSFRDIDDFYISERLLAVAYGCALRTSKNDSLRCIAQYIYDNIFKLGNPPAHVLLRDYARNIVEYALYKKLPIEGNMELIRPPYKSKMPEKMPTKEDIEKFKMDHESPEHDKKYGYYNNQIHFSVMDWDFGRYTIASAFRNFSPQSFTFEQEYKKYLKDSPKKIRDFLKLFATSYDLNCALQERKDSFSQSTSEKTVFDDLINSSQQNFKDLEEKTKTVLNEEQREYLKNKIIPHLEGAQKIKGLHHGYFNTLPVACWIVQRVFELGYNSKLHGFYDSHLENHGRSKNKIERIGKKYQCIALHEILAIVADNHKVKEYWGSDTKYKYCQGGWQLGVRDIDPVFTSQKNHDEEQKDELGIINIPAHWWFDSPYSYWNQTNSEWIANTQDLPDPMQIIERIDETRQNWLYLSVNTSWNEPKPIGQDNYQIPRKEIWYMINGYLIHKKDRTKIIKWLQEQNFFGRWMPENRGTNEQFNRENYWSPASKEFQRGEKVWEKIGESAHKAVVAVSQAAGGISDDKSGAHFSYDMPCRTIFEGMQLQYASKDGEFINDDGEIIVSNVNPRGVLIRKKDLLQFLNNKNLDIIWTILGEKRTLGGSHPQGERYHRILNGVYFMDDEKLMGYLTSQEEEP